MSLWFIHVFLLRLNRSPLCDMFLFIYLLIGTWVISILSVVNHAAMNKYVFEPLFLMWALLYSLKCNCWIIW